MSKHRVDKSSLCFSFRGRSSQGEGDNTGEQKEIHDEDLKLPTEPTRMRTRAVVKIWEPDWAFIPAQHMVTKESGPQQLGL